MEENLYLCTTEVPYWFGKLAFQFVIMMKSRHYWFFPKRSSAIGILYEFYLIKCITKKTKDLMKVIFSLQGVGKVEQIKLQFIKIC